MSYVLTTLLLVCMVLIHCTNAIQTELHAGKSVCFSEDLPANTPVTITYSPPPTVALSTLIVRDPFGSILLEERDFTSHQPHRTFLTTKGDVSGQYEICILPTQFSKDHIYKQPVFAQITIDADRFHYEKDQPTTKDEVEKLDTLLQDVRHKIDSISLEQYYFKEREERFRHTTDSTHERCWWLGVCKFSLLVGVTLWQMTNLRSFFKKKKLI
ncbi:hypothetical protein FDP41_012794 [Naegleria fowleri]|uniref:GOLD domain-containing protein n=1 Tax=Naegleria fowleri TaxID=5763 RepID=A0A6A5C018_NAEFO|nr:uncharacterized protein FDP41_012794 [Naegleria fowleri]KAF0981006.1 hypothetical protein FDP41_012794 [Naegleria fowleri]CAG4717755.1 unnamed protein product [Naegleria fowleri]